MRISSLTVPVLLLWAAGNLLGQPQEGYYTYVSQAEAAYAVEDPETAVAWYRRAFATATPVATDLYNAACCYALTHRNDTALLYVARAVEAGWLDLAWLRRDSDLLSLHDHPRWPLLLADLEQQAARWQTHLDVALMARLEAMQRADQYHRLRTDSVATAAGRGSDAWHTLQATIAATDHQNVAQLTALLDTAGWPGYSRVGRAGSHTAARVLMRADAATQARFLPLLLEAAENQEADWQQAAELQDVLLLQRGRKQWYGSQVVYEPRTRRYAPCPIRQQRRVDRRRRQIGLPPLEEYVRGRNLLLSYDPSN